MAINTGNNLDTFLSLVKVGLWEKDVQLSSSGIDFSIVYQFARQQAVIGLVAAGIEKIKNVSSDKEIVLNFISAALELGQQNTAMNRFISVLVKKMSDAGIYTLLVKGQGIAQCYERPLWRACGDVDLLLSEDNYAKAKSFLLPLAQSINEENSKKRHLSLIIDSWVVELHGSLHSGLWKRLDREIDRTQSFVFFEGNVRSWMNGHTPIFLPKEDEDVVFVFAHILQHFFKEGIGLRQICDWCRLLWTYKESIDKRLLESRLRRMKVMTEWKSFAHLAVNTLGMPAEAMPFYSNKKKWGRKSDKILSFIIETGNFGHNRDYSYLKKYPYVIYKMISLWKHLKDGIFFFSIFPLDSFKVTFNRMFVGLSVVLQGKQHE